MHTGNNWECHNLPTPTATANTVAAYAEGSDDGCSSSLFGIVIPGYPLATNVTPIDALRWTFTVGAPASDFAVFLTAAGTALLPVGYGIGVYVSIGPSTPLWMNNHNLVHNCPNAPATYQNMEGCYPPPAGCTPSGGGGEAPSQLFHYIGCLRAERPSGLFSVPASLLPSDKASSTCILGGGSQSRIVEGQGKCQWNEDDYRASPGYRFPVGSGGAASNREETAPCLFPPMNPSTAQPTSAVPFSASDTSAPTDFPTATATSTSSGNNNTNVVRHTMIVGLAMEPIDLLNSLCDTPLQAKMETKGTKVAIAEKILESFYSFVSSYAKVLKPQYFFPPAPVNPSASDTLRWDGNAPLENMNRDGGTEMGSRMRSSLFSPSSIMEEREAFLTSLFSFSVTADTTSSRTGGGGFYDTPTYPLQSSGDRCGDPGNSNNNNDDTGGEFLVLPINFVNKWRQRLERVLQNDKFFISN